MSSSLRLFSPKLPQTLPIPKAPFLSSKPLFSFFLPSSPISFQRLPTPSLPLPIKAQQPNQERNVFDLSLLPPKLQEIVSLFQSVPDSKAKYQQLLHYGGQLPPYDPHFKDEAHRVRGCVSQVWVRAFPDPADPSAVRFEADSDSALTKGLAALLVFGLSGSPPAVISRVPPEFVHLLGLQQSLTPSRNNGFLNMLKLMQAKALEIDGQDSSLGKTADGFGGDSVASGVSGIKASPLSAKYGNSEERNANLGENGNGFEGSSNIDQVSGVNGHDASGSGGVMEGKDASFDPKINGVPEAEGDDLGVVEEVSSLYNFGGRRERIRERLEKELSPVELEVEDISYQHAGHAGVSGTSGGETHFNLRVVSKEFEGKSMIKRHRLIYDLLREELESGLHALSIVAKTPSEVQPS